MPRSFDLNKTWIPGNYRGTTTFNSSSTLNIAYGRYKGTISGRGGSGNPAGFPYTPASYNTV
ncbi:MAG TPA: hypothetical protein DEB23_04655, partial [Chitinophagaceae bacterium]|nr:hypothetical protein [Chitinophagaceae bacterium]